MTDKVPMTALIVCHNEAHLLEARLRELSFCNELIVADVVSTDGSVAVAEANGARVISHPFVRTSELVHVNVLDDVANDLVVLLDPDEELPQPLAAQLAALPSSLDDDVAIVIVPRIYYFAGKPLAGTIWGGVTGKRLVARRSATTFIPAVHYGLDPKPGFRIVHIDFDGTNAIRHLWSSGYRDFIRKHVRFIRIEGAARAFTGEITGYRAAVRTPWRSFRVCFIQKQGYRDGFRGFALSVLYALYRTGSDLALIRELRGREAPS